MADFFPRGHHQFEMPSSAESQIPRLQGPLVDLLVDPRHKEIFSDTVSDREDQGTDDGRHIGKGVF